MVPWNLGMCWRTLILVWLKTCLVHLYQLHFKIGAKEDSIQGNGGWSQALWGVLAKDFKAFELVTRNHKAYGRGADKLT